MGDPTSAKTTGTEERDLSGAAAVFGPELVALVSRPADEKRPKSVRKNENNLTARHKLVLAVERGDAEGVRTLLAAGAPLDGAGELNRWGRDNGGLEVKMMTHFQADVADALWPAVWSATRTYKGSCLERMLTVAANNESEDAIHWISEWMGRLTEKEEVREVFYGFDYILGRDQSLDARKRIALAGAAFLNSCGAEVGADERGTTARICDEGLKIGIGAEVFTPERMEIYISRKLKRPGEFLGLDELSRLLPLMADPGLASGFARACEQAQFAVGMDRTASKQCGMGEEGASMVKSLIGVLVVRGDSDFRDAVLSDGGTSQRLADAMIADRSEMIGLLQTLPSRDIAKLVSRNRGALTDFRDAAGNTFGLIALAHEGKRTKTLVEALMTLGPEQFMTRNSVGTAGLDLIDGPLRVKAERFVLGREKEQRTYPSEKRAF